MIKKIRNTFLVLFLILLVLLIGIGPKAVWSNAQQIYNKWMILTMILEKIERFYVDEQDPDDLLKDAIDGMLFGLDPHSVYLTAKEYKDFSKKYDGYFGFGLKYSRLDSHLVVTSLVKDGPAERGGIRIGDRIVKIAGAKTAEMTNAELDNFLSGQNEKIVTLVIQREPETRMTLELVKKQVIDDTIPVSFLVQDGTGYIKIAYFSNATPQELDDALVELESTGMRRLLLDLRDNTGGTFEAGVAVADRFLPRGKMIVFTRGRAPQSSQQFISRIDRYTNIPMVVLVNETTASDAEIVSGALQDWDRALIVGRRTYGKALVQTEYAFQDESVLLLTTARYYTPLGRLIQKDYHVENGETAKKKQEPQKYQTPKGRVVYGGGGIQPDIEVDKIKREFPKSLSAVYAHDENIFFKFADKYVISNADMKNQQMNEFLYHFVVDAMLWKQFVDFLEQENIAVAPADVQANAGFLKNEIKIEIAGRLWGDRGRFAAMTINDPEVKKGMTYFDKATALLQR